MLEKLIECSLDAFSPIWTIWRTIAFLGMAIIASPQIGISELLHLLGASISSAAAAIGSALLELSSFYFITAIVLAFVVVPYLVSIVSYLLIRKVHLRMATSLVEAVSKEYKKPVSELSVDQVVDIDAWRRRGARSIDRIRGLLELYVGVALYLGYFGVKQVGLGVWVVPLVLSVLVVVFVSSRWILFFYARDALPGRLVMNG